MLRSDWKLRSIFVAMALGLALLTSGLAINTFFNTPEANAKTYRTTKIGACNAYLSPSTKPWCAEVFKIGSEYRLAVTF